MKTLKRNLPVRQRGVSKFGLVVLFILIASFLTVGLKLAPIYVDHNLITGILDELIDNGEAANMSITEVRQRVANSLRINNVIGFDLSAITMRKVGGQPIINVAYERRIELFANLDVVGKFDTTLE